MPRWNIRCPACNEIHEMRFEDAADRDDWLPHLICSNHCGLPLEVMPNKVGFKLKGKGFHSNDYPRKVER